MPRSVRYKGQNTVDTAVWRFGDVAIASGMNGLRTIGMATGGFASLSAGAALAAAAIGWRLARETEHITEERRVGKECVGKGSARWSPSTEKKKIEERPS